MQINEFKRIFSRTTNLSKIDSNRWKLTMRKDYSISKKGKATVYQLSFYFDNILVDCWAVFVKKIISIGYEDIRLLNKYSEKLFAEEWFYGIKDKNAVLSMLDQVEAQYFGYVLYPTIIRKAAYLWYHIATKQMFNNGNKRTALLAGLFLLNINGYKMDEISVNDLYNISLKLANHKMKYEELITYIYAHIRIDFEWTQSQIDELTK